MVAGSNPAVPTLRDRLRGKAARVLDTIYLLLGIVGFMAVIAGFFFGSFLLLDFIWGRRGGDA